MSGALSVLLFAAPTGTAFGMDASSAKLPLREPRLLVDCVSVLSKPRLVVDSPAKPEEDARGLSADLLPGIFVLRALRKDRIDSFVSDLLNEGYDSRLGPAPVGVCDPLLFPSLDGWLPILLCPRSLGLFHAIQVGRLCFRVG